MSHPEPTPQDAVSRVLAGSISLIDDCEGLATDGVRVAQRRRLVDAVMSDTDETGRKVRAILGLEKGQLRHAG